MIDRPRNTAEQTCREQVRSRVAIGAVSYLNSKPLVEGLKELCPEADVILDVPSRLADELATGRLDVALIPSVESFANPCYQIVSDACVATRGPVLSVKLYSRVHPGAIRTLALDEGSRTSAALSKVLLWERYGVKPEVQTLPLQQGTEDTTTDAVLLIGDRAMTPPVEEFHTVWDLGEEWVNWTGLPFVFAMWVSPLGEGLGEIPHKLSAARDLGLQRIEQIARDGSEKLQIDYAVAHHYLTSNLHFKLGPAERAGLKLFRELAIELGLVRASFSEKAAHCCAQAAALQPVS